MTVVVEPPGTVACTAFAVPGVTMGQEMQIGMLPAWAIKPAASTRGPPVNCVWIACGLLLA